jgi:MFS family permease
MGFLGPVIGPIVGGFIAESNSLSWRWTEWITLIVSGALLAVLLLFQPETHGPVLLKWKAHHLRVLNKDNRFQGSVESERVPWALQIKVAVQRPFEMFIQEPTIALWTLYLTFVYGVNFGFLSIYPVIFGGIYGQSDSNTGLIFLGLGVGFIIATVPTTPLVYNWTRSALEKIRKENPTMTDVKLAPESRLWYAMIASPAIPISLFWMAWTANASINIWSPILASVLFGYGYISIYLSTYLYLIDVYESYAASALTINTLVRYIVSGIMVTAVIPICRSIGASWTLTWLACVALAFTPAPYLFYRFGPWIRSKSKYGS